MAQQMMEPQGSMTQQPTGQMGQMGQMDQMGQQGGQMGQTSQMGRGGQMGARLQDVESPQQREAIHAIARAVQVCEWCADQCIQHADQRMIECIRLCEDVSEIGETALTLVPRNSRHAGSVLGTFLQAAQACAQECSRHQHGHCQECAQVLGQTVSSVQQLLGQQGGQMGQTSQMSQGGQMSQMGQQGGQMGRMSQSGM